MAKKKIMVTDVGKLPCIVCRQGVTRYMCVNDLKVGQIPERRKAIGEKKQIQIERRPMPQEGIS